MSTVISNVVNQKKLREIQLKTLEEVKNSLILSFGPMGSNTCIKLDKAANKYSKDGHTILSNIRYNGFIEQSVVEDLQDLTRHITVTVGDGTTSAVILSSLIFDELVKEADGKLPFQIIQDFKNAVSEIKEKILSHRRECTPDDIYNIALISTNNNEDIAKNLKSIYEEFGMEVFIDVNISNSEENLIKIYDGVTIAAGYADSCFVNNTTANTATVRNPRVYVFEDPIDTPEMISLFDSILEKNIIYGYNQQNIDLVVPTVILTPKISKDMSTYMDKLAEVMSKLDSGNRPPLLIVTNIYKQDEFIDLAKLCGATLIKKYLDPKIQEEDIKRGLAPTPDNVTEFYGTCDEVVSDSAKTKVINPAKMKNPDGSYSDLFNAMVKYYEAELAKAKAEGADANVTGNLKRRINTLKANMVEYLVGGVSMSDRDSLRDLVEDAVLNCRSAAYNGVGYGANYEGLVASMQLTDDTKTDNYIYKIIANAYKELMKTLYNTCIPTSKVQEFIDTTMVEKMPVNLRTLKFDGKVLSSIESDIIILETISKIITLMFTCNQFLVPTSVHNIYMMSE